MKKKIIYTILICILYVLIFSSKDIYAAGNVTLSSNLYDVKKEEIFEISINLENLPACAIQLELYFDTDKLEYISGPETSNNIENTVYYIWVDETGGNNPRQNGNIVTFSFKAKELGMANFSVSGVIFDKDGNELVTSFNGTSVYILDTTQTTKTNTISVSSEDNNAYLQIMRLGVEGISPDFDRNIMEYFLIVNSSVSSLNITAIPENENAKVNIYGDTRVKNWIK